MLTLCQCTITAIYKSGPEAGSSTVLLYNLHIDRNIELFFIDPKIIGGQNKETNTGISQTLHRFVLD